MSLQLDCVPFSVLLVVIHPNTAVFPEFMGLKLGSVLLCVSFSVLLLVIHLNTAVFPEFMGLKFSSVPCSLASGPTTSCPHQGSTVGREVLLLFPVRAVME